MILVQCVITQKQKLIDFMKKKFQRLISIFVVLYTCIILYKMSLILIIAHVCITNVSQ